MERNMTSHNIDKSDQLEPAVNLQEELINSTEEMAEILSAFGRFSRPNRRNTNAGVESDFTSSMLENNADEKLEMLIRQVAKLNNKQDILNFVRGLFPDDSDLMLALREMLLSRKLSELQKQKVKEAIKDMEKFCDKQKLQSGINIGQLAKRFKTSDGDRSLSAKDLRRSYLRFIECDLPPGYIYQDWIDEFGFDNRKRLLVFTLSALIADMKANEPGIHFEEFGQLSGKLSDARILHTLDQSLNEKFSEFNFREQMRNQQRLITEEDIVSLYMKGVVNFPKFKDKIIEFSDNYFPLLLIKHRIAVIQTLRTIYSMTPDYLFSDAVFKEEVMDFMAELITMLYKKEKVLGISV